MTLQECQKMVKAAGFTNSSADWENESHVYAFSVECHGPQTYGHPKHTVHYQKYSGWLEQTGKSAIKLPLTQES